MTDWWIGIDLDGTLAIDSGWKGVEHIGELANSELAQGIQELVDNGIRVKIFTARADYPQSTKIIQDYLASYDLPKLEVTNVKDRWCYQIWDDKARQVKYNKGTFLGDKSVEDVVDLIIKNSESEKEESDYESYTERD